MNTVCHKYFVFFCIIFATFCSERKKNISQLQRSIDLILSDPTIQPFDSSVTPNSVYLWNAKACVINHSKDTIWIYKGKFTNGLIASVDYYSIKSNIVYKGKYYPHSPFCRLDMVLPLDTNVYEFNFLLPREAVDMDNMYIKVSPEYSLTLIHDTVVVQQYNNLIKNTLYRSPYLFYVEDKTKKIQSLDYNIDSIINARKYRVINFNF